MDIAIENADLYSQNLGLNLKIADFAGRTKQFKEANHYLKQAEKQIINENNTIFPDLNNKVFYQQLMFRKKLYNNNLITDLEDFIQMEENIRRLNVEKYNKLKETMIINTEKNIELLHVKETSLQAKKKAYNYLIIILFIFVLLLVLIFILLRLKIKTNRQINTQKNALENALGRSNFLLKEIHHRVKNNLQLMSSLALIEHSNNPNNFNINSYEKKVFSLSIIHDLLYNSKDISQIYMQVYTKQLVYYLAKASGDKFEYNLDITETVISIDKAITLGLLINELISNTLKHCIPKDNNKINIKISIHKTDQWIFNYIDNGSQFANKASKKSFGNIMLHLLVKNLNGFCEINVKNGYHFYAQIDLNFPEQQDKI